MTDNLMQAIGFTKYLWRRFLEPNISALNPDIEHYFGLVNNAPAQYQLFDFLLAFTVMRPVQITENACRWNRQAGS